MKRFIWIIIVLVFHGLTATAWAAEKFTILVIPKDNSVEFWHWIKEGAIKAGKDRNVKIIYRGPRTADDYDAQVSIIESGIEDNVDAIVIAPNHTSKATKVLERAISKGIKVILIDSDMELDGRTSFVASDSSNAGKDAARYLLSIVDKFDSVLVVRYKENNQSTMEREHSFIDEVKKRSQTNKIIVSDYTGANAGDIHNVCKMMLQKHQDVEAVFTSAEALTVNCLRVLNELDIAGYTKLVGFDYTDEIHKALDDKHIQGVVLQRPFKMGYLGVMAACDALEGKTVRPRIVVETVIVSKSDKVLDYISTLRQ